MITLLHWLFLPHLTVPLECEIAERCRRMGRVRRMRLDTNPHLFYPDREEIFKLRPMSDSEAGR